MGIAQNLTLRAYFSRKRILPTAEFGDVISGGRLQLIMKFLHSEGNTKKANYEGAAQLYKIFPVVSHLKDAE
jgi:hypothetical protein